MCLETSSELMTFQHVVLILLEMNVSGLGVSSVLGFNGYYQFMLVPTLRFAPPQYSVSRKYLSNVYVPLLRSKFFSTRDLKS